MRENGSVFSVLSAWILNLYFTHLSLFCNYLVITSVITMYMYIFIYHLSLYPSIIESVDSINRDERGFNLTQYITNGGISSARNTSTHFKHNHRVLRLISNRMSV